MGVQPSKRNSRSTATRLFWSRAMGRGRKPTDYTGRVFGRLTVVRDAESRNGRRYVVCRCTCGNECTVSLDALRVGDTLSCGCLRRALKTMCAKDMI